MVFESFSQLTSDPFSGVVTLLSLLLALTIAITFHEFSHALVATLLGDTMASRLGRLSLHPKAHLDPVGSVMILLAGFGWGKPVPVQARSLRPGERPGMAMVSLAGPMANLLVAAILGAFVKTGAIPYLVVGTSLFGGGGPGDVAAYVAGSIVFWNLLLAAFNLIPLAPLDGFKVALGILPRSLAKPFGRIERFGPVILALLVIMEVVFPSGGILSFVVGPLMNALAALVL